MANLGITNVQLLKLFDKHFKPYGDSLLIENNSQFQELWNELNPYSSLGLSNRYFYISTSNKKLTIKLRTWYLKTEQIINERPATKESLIAFLNDFNVLVSRKTALKAKRGKITKLTSEAVVAQAKKMFGDNLHWHRVDSTKIELWVYAFNKQNIIDIWVPLSMFKEVLPHLKTVIENINKFESLENIPKQFIFGNIKAVLSACRFRIHKTILLGKQCKFMKCKSWEIDCAPKKVVKHHRRQNGIRRAKMLEKTNLFQSWSAAKQQAESSKGVDKIIEHLEAMGIKEVSPVNVVLVLQQAHAVGYKGMPYVHFKTFEGWREVGKRVKRGEECKIHTITWCASSKPKGNEDAPADAPKQSGHLWPKRTCLFHESQCE